MPLRLVGIRRPALVLVVGALQRLAALSAFGRRVGVALLVLVDSFEVAVGGGFGRLRHGVGHIQAYYLRAASDYSAAYSAGLSGKSARLGDDVGSAIDPNGGRRAQGPTVDPNGGLGDDAGSDMPVEITGLSSTKTSVCF